jgi:glycosyltransferase involved in cell wall biosynthesis
MDLSIVIPARNEQWLQNTIDDILRNIEADTEIIVVLDGYWPYEAIKDDPKVKLIHHTVSVGQRAGTNDGVKLSRAKYVMKCDAHCAFDKGFDRKLLEKIERGQTVIPRMYNLHVFDWVCKDCGERKYQGPTPEDCSKCHGKNVQKEIVWKPRLNRRTDFTMFDKGLHFQYWASYEKRPEAAGDIADVMGNLGACWMMARDRYWAIGGLDEAHGSWGQMGTEISCKTWLSGGRQVVNKTTWFSHLFRTQGGDFGFPYPISDRQVEHARRRSRELWMENHWEKAIRKIDWIINKFGPVPTWTI